MSSAGGRAIRGLGQLLLAQQHHAATVGSAQAASSIALRLLGTASTSSSLPWRQEPGNSGSSGSNSRGAVLGALGLSAAAAGALAAQRHTAHADAETVSPTVSANPYKWPEDAKGVLPKTITLWQYEVCPFCCKVKAALDYYKLPYTVIEVNPLTKGELKWSTYKKVPVVKLDDVVVADSSQIMSRLAAEVAAARRAEEHQAAAAAARLSWGSKKQPAAAPAPAGCSPEEEERWRRWVDERMVKVLTANIYRSWDETWESFRYITKHTNWSWGTREVARMSGAVLMWQIGKRMPAKYKIEGDLRANLYACCDEFMDAIGPSRPFLGGAVVNLADLSVYGILKAIEHTPTFDDCMSHSRIAAWYKRVEEAIGPSARLP